MAGTSAPGSVFTTISEPVTSYYDEGKNPVWCTPIITTGRHEIACAMYMYNGVPDSGWWKDETQKKKCINEFLISTVESYSLQQK